MPGIKDKCVPKLRFPQFKNDGEWDVKELRDVADRITDKNTRNLELPVLTNSATEGVIKQTDYFEREIVTKENLCNYYIAETDDFVYNPRISSTAPVGPVSRNKGECGLLSPLYTIFRFKEGHLDFYEQFFKTNNWHYYLKKKANYGARFDRINISSEDFFSMPIPVPSLKEQKAIASCLTSLDACISASKAKLEQLKVHKTGLMQKLFPAPGKTLPEYRSPEYADSGEWAVAKLDDIIKMVSPPKKLQSSEYYSSGRYPIIDQSKDFTCGYSNDESAVFNKGSEMVIIFGDHTCVLKMVNFPFIQGADGIRVFESKIPEIVSTLFLYHYLSYSPIEPIQYKRHFFELKEREIKYPVDISEQYSITTCLSSLDSLITASKDKLNQQIAYKKGLMRQLFPSLND